MVRTAFAAALAVSTLSVAVNAHTNMAVPVLKWPDNFYNGNSPMGRIESSTFKQASDPQYYGTNKIAKVMESYKSLRELISQNVNVTTIDGHKANKECGLTITTGEKQPLPDAIDFPWGHPGPCEVWCDNTRIFYDGDCQGNNVGKVPVDKTKCKGVSIIQAMYVGVHVSNWEVYANCAPIVGGTETDPATLFKSGAAAGAASGSDTTGNDATTKPAATTAKPASGSDDEYDDETPAATTKAPASGSDDEYDDETPAATTKAPAATTASPAATTKAPTTTAPKPAATTACKRRARN